MSETLSDYQYQAIPNKNSIRMLTLEPGNRDEPLKGTLEFVNVDKAGNYEALSYVWNQAGSLDTSKVTILLLDVNDARSLELTASLYSALARIRSPDRRRRIWADQICINQKDHDERSDQIKFMNKIYKNANQVLVWLGLDTERLAESAFGLISKLDEAFNDEEEQKKLHVAYTKGLEHQSEDEWRGLDHLTDLPWFKRGWIVQEIGTKAPATLFWGESKIDWMAMHRVCEKLTDYHHLRSKFNIRTSDIKYVFQRFIEPDPESYHANRFNFIYELHRARGLSLTDQRDRIFAWLGHYSVRGQNEQLARLEANYRKSIAEVYIDVAKRALTGKNDETTGSALIALAAVQHMSLRSRKSAETNSDAKAGTADENKLPTWVPDWRIYQSFILSEPISPHRAHGESSPKLEIVGEPPVLRIHGVEFDTVKMCSRPLESKGFHTMKANREIELPIEYLWHEVCNKGQLNLTEQYPNGEEALFALMQTLSNGCVQIAGREKKAYRDIPKTRWLSQHATYLAKAMGPSGALCPKLRELAEKAADEHEGEHWSRAANGASKNRKLARTERGYYVLGPKVMEEGDIICVFFGGKLPFCLRPWKHQFLLVGECHVHGLMDGEAMAMIGRGGLSEKMFEIV